MQGKIESGQLCVVEPVGDDSILQTGDLKAIRGNRFQMGNNRGSINGWIGPQAIFGRLIRVEP
jgi:hypothetical protein